MKAHASAACAKSMLGEICPESAIEDIDRAKLIELCIR